MKKDIKAWAIKLRNRSFLRSHNGVPFIYMTKAEASAVALRAANANGTTAEPIRIKVRIEEIE